MCQGGTCKKCGAACKAPEPKSGVTKGGPVNADGHDMAKQNAAAAKKTRGKRF